MSHLLGFAVFFGGGAGSGGKLVFSQVLKENSKQNSYLYCYKFTVYIVTVYIVTSLQFILLQVLQFILLQVYSLYIKVKLNLFLLKKHCFMKAYVGMLI